MVIAPLLNAFTAFFRTIYGVLIGSIPIIVFRPIICLNVLLILCAKFVYDKKNITKEEINNNESDSDNDNNNDNDNKIIIK